MGFFEIFDYRWLTGLSHFLTAFDADVSKAENIRTHRIYLECGQQWSATCLQDFFIFFYHPASKARFLPRRTGETCYWLCLLIWLRLGGDEKTVCVQGTSPLTYAVTTFVAVWNVAYDNAVRQISGEFARLNLRHKWQKSLPRPPNRWRVNSGGHVVSNSIHNDKMTSERFGRVSSIVLFDISLTN